MNELICPVCRESPDFTTRCSHIFHRSFLEFWLLEDRDIVELMNELIEADKHNQGINLAIRKLSEEIVSYNNSAEVSKMVYKDFVYSNLDIVKLFIRKGADVNVANTEHPAAVI